MTLHEGSTAEELRALRARAYGPYADIEEDPVALRRLHELEEQARPETSGAIAAPPERDGERAGTPQGAAESPRASGAEGPAPRADPAAPAGPDPGSEGEVAPVPAGAGRPPPWRPTRRRMLWLASIVVAGLAASAVTLAVAPLAEGRVAVLQADPDAEQPAGVFPGTSDAMLFEDFYGMTAVLVKQDWNRGEVLDCLFVRRTAGDADPATGGCAGAGFAPTAAFVVSDSFPQELRDRFADGTGLQFRASGSEVHVYAKSPVIQPTP